MDPQRFDHLSRAIARRLTRRGMLAGLGAGGVAAAFGDAPTSAAASAITCVYAFDGTIDLGPSSALGATSEVVGELTITMSPEGAIDAGQFVNAAGERWKVVGQAVGRAINLRFSVPDTGAFVAVGTARHAISTCPAAMAGPASGPLRRDLGSWTATLRSSGASTAPSATETTGAGSVSGGASGDGATPTSTAAPATDPTAQATQASAGECDIECGDDTLGRDPNGCACLCTAGFTSCTLEIGSIPAKGGVIFKAKPLTRTTGFCFDLSSDSSNCGACSNNCGYTAGTDSLTCDAGACAYDCKGGFDSCGGTTPCGVDLGNDDENCGTCGHACPSATHCVAGVCACGDDACGAGATIECAAGLTSCGALCVDVNTDPDNCGACGNVCLPAERNCAGGACHGELAPTQ